jgi:hypothetical protein
VIARRLIAAIAIGVLLAAPAPASANGDPASDVLLQEDVFFPYDPPTSDGVARAVKELTRRTRKDGWPIKVAIIATASDLGAAANLFNFPDRYAGLLLREIGGDARLLVVTPHVFAGRRLGDRVDSTLEDLEPAEGGDALARRALLAVSRLAKQAGHGVKTPQIDRSAAGRRPYREKIAAHGAPQGAGVASAETPASDDGGGGSGDGGGTAWWLFAGPILIVALVLVVQNRRERRAPEGADDGDGDR